MVVPTRQAMRLLSPRIQGAGHSCLPHVRQLRHVTTGRYSSARSNDQPAGATSASFDRRRQPVTSTQPPFDPTRDALRHRDQLLAQMEHKKYHLRRMRWAGLGLLSSFAALMMIIWNIDLDELEKSEEKRRARSGQRLDASDEGNQQFQGKEIHVLGLGPDKRIVAQGDGVEIDLVETGTSSVPHFPRTIYLPNSPDSQPENANPGAALITAPNVPSNPGNFSNQEEYTLVGLGIRSVLFIQVYVVGMYVRTQDINAMQEKLIHAVNPTASTLVPSEKDGLREKLLDPTQSRILWEQLLKVPGLKTAWRIAPTRNTDFGHLRDGFVNGINARTQEARRLLAGKETEFDAEDFGRSVQDLKSVFAGGKAPKGSILILARDQKGKLDVLFQAKPESKSGGQEMELLGSVQDERISRLLWLGYLAGDKVSSKAAREGVVDGCITFATRPIGSLATRVI